MPELPEVECLVRAVRDVALESRVVGVKFYRSDLRYEIPTRAFRQMFMDESIVAVSRRSKYMLWESRQGYGIFHLGMSGNMLCHDTAKPQQKHTHAVITVKSGKSMRYLHFVDPRRFGLIDCCKREDLEEHPFFRSLGPEPLANKTLADTLFKKSRRKTAAIKTFLMDSHVVVGVGNIYASESLFKSGLHPEIPAGKITLEQFRRLAKAIQETLAAAIKAGGTTFRDYRNPDGNPGRFRMKLAVYDRKGERCNRCETPIISLRQTGRATYFCPNCQPFPQKM